MIPMNTVIATIACASALFLFLVMIACAFAGNPVKDAFEEIQKEDAK